jgi:hypothetical protein
LEFSPHMYPAHISTMALSRGQGVRARECVLLRDKYARVWRQCQLRCCGKRSCEVEHETPNWLDMGRPRRFRMVRLYETIERLGDSNRLYGGTKMKSNMSDDLEDIPMAYFWYPFLAIVAMVVGAVAVVLKMV